MKNSIYNPSLKLLGMFMLAIFNLNLVAQHPSIGGYNVYYGDMHNHSNVSDGTGAPATAYNYARNTAHLDFFSLSDHSNAITSAEWVDIKNQANAYNEDGVFITFWGFEWSSGGNFGHVSVYGTDDYCTTNSPTSTFNAFVSWLSSRNCVAFFNHPGRENAAGMEFNHFTSSLSDKIFGIELWNKGDNFNYYYYNDGYFTGDNNKSYYDEALSRGWMIGAWGGGDNHWATWGNAVPLKVAVLANNLTRTDILNAIKSKRFYSTLDRNIALSFKIHGKEMGSSLVSGNYNLQIQALDSDGEKFTQVVLFDKKHNKLNTWMPDSSFVDINTSLITLDKDYYYIKVTQADGGEAISSPIWIIGNPPDAIITAAGPAIFCQDSSVVLNANKGTGLFYQWQVNSSNIDGATLNSFTANASGIYRVIVTAGEASSSSNTISVTVSGPPEINITKDTIYKFFGDSVTFNILAEGRPPFRYQWLKDEIPLSNATNSIYRIKDIKAGDMGEYSCMIENFCGVVTAKITSLILTPPDGYSIKGRISYDNISLSGIGNINVYFENIENNSVDSATTDTSGNYSISNVISGKYKFTLKTNLKHGGLNLLDAVLVNRYYIRLYSFSDNLRKLAADVTNDKKINPIDALLINRRFIGLISKFKTDDWLYYKATVFVKRDTIYHIKVICVGDVDASRKF